MVFEYFGIGVGGGYFVEIFWIEDGCFGVIFCFLEDVCDVKIDDFYVFFI